MFLKKILSEKYILSIITPFFGLFAYMYNIMFLHIVQENGHKIFFLSKL